MNEIEIQRIVRALKKIFPQDTRDNMFYGEVTKTEPLEIKAGKMTIQEEFLVLGQNCRPHKVTIPHNHLINALMTQPTKSVNTTTIIQGVPVDVPQSGTYDVKTQEIIKNADGTTKRTLKTEPQAGVNLGGATFQLAIDISGSPVSGSIAGTDTVTGAPVTGSFSGSVTSTSDGTQFANSDLGHSHIIPEHETQDVHFPKTDYEDSVELEIYPRLAVGDTVLLFAFNNFQRFYVAERVTAATES